HLRVALLVALHAGPAHLDPPGHRVLPDRGPHRLAPPADLPGGPDVHRLDHTHHANLPRTTCPPGQATRPLPPGPPAARVGSRRQPPPPPPRPPPPAPRPPAGIPGRRPPNARAPEVAMDDPTAEPIDLPEGYGTAKRTMEWAAVRERLEQAPRDWLGPPPRGT